MLHLVQRTVSPWIRLPVAVKDWYDISCMLREAPRRRLSAIGRIVALSASLS